MKRALILSALLLVLILVLRECGVFQLNFYTSYSESMSGASDNVRPMQAGTIVYHDNHGQPYMPPMKPFDDTTDNARVTVTYDITTDMSPWRWLPFFKFGSNRSQLNYIVWVEQTVQSCGSIYTTTSQRLAGIASAREYEKRLTDALVKEMETTLDKKLTLVKK